MNTSLSRSVVTATALALGLGTSGCNFFKPPCDNCGVIQSIKSRTAQGKPNAAGTVAGAIVGGVVGHQFGSGRGNDLATAAGAVGGAMLGHEVEKDRAKYVVYDVTIKMDAGGGLRHLTLGTIAGLRTGDHVEVVDNSVIPRNG